MLKRWPLPRINNNGIANRAINKIIIQKTAIVSLMTISSMNPATVWPGSIFAISLQLALHGRLSSITTIFTHPVPHLLWGEHPICKCGVPPIAAHYAKGLHCPYRETTRSWHFGARLLQGGSYAYKLVHADFYRAVLRCASRVYNGRCQ